MSELLPMAVKFSPAFGTSSPENPRHYDTRSLSYALGNRSRSAREIKSSNLTRDKASLGTSTRAAKGLCTGRVASTIIFAVMMSSVWDGSRVFPLTFLMMSTSWSACTRVATAHITSSSL